MALEIDDTTLLVALSTLVFLLNLAIIFLVAKYSNKRIMKKTAALEESLAKKTNSLEENMQTIGKAVLSLQEDASKIEIANLTLEERFAMLEKQINSLSKKSQ
ncbi:MAG TPA: hypothetical protein VI977_06000 [archaeon]|nr:hypothetical protein [archaeon]